MEPSAEVAWDHGIPQTKDPNWVPQNAHTEPCTGEAEQESKCEDSVWKRVP